MRMGLMTPTAALLLLAGLPGAADAQESACRSEIERLATAFFPDSELGQDEASAMAPSGSLSGPLENAPGARKGAGMGEEQRDRLRGLIEEAVEAADQGNEQDCIQQLAEARTLAREAGIGSAGAGATPPVPETAAGGAAAGVAQGASRPTGEAVDREADLGAAGSDAADPGAAGDPGMTDGGATLRPGAGTGPTGGRTGAAGTGTGAGAAGTSGGAGAGGGSSAGGAD